MRPTAVSLRSCLFPLLEALGWQGDRAVLEEYLGNRDAAFRLTDFRNVMAALRFGSRSAPCRLRDIGDAILPCLYVGRDGRPYCVLRRTDKGLFVFDGASGAYSSLPPASDSGTVAVFRPLGEKEDSVLASRPDWLGLILRRFKAHFASALGLSLVLGALSLLYPLLIALLYGQMTIRGNEGALAGLGLGVALFIAADSGFRFLRSLILGYASLRSCKVIGDELFRRLVSFQSSFTESASSEAQVRRIRDLRTVSDFIAGNALAALFDLPFVAVMILWLISAGGAVALVPVLGLAAFVAASAAAYPAMKRAQAEASRIRGERMDVAASMAEGAEDIAGAGMREAWLGKFDAASAAAAAAGYSESLRSAAISAVSGFFVSAGGLATLYAGVLAVLGGSMPSSALVAAMMLVWRVLGIARSTFVILNQTDALGGSLRQLQRFMSLPQETRPTAFTVPQRLPEGDLQFRDVSFRYGPEGYPALYGVNLVTEAGRVSVVCGHQGAGKTTLLKLALGLYRPQAGRVLIGPFNLQQSDPAQLRRAIAYAPERPALIRGSLREFLRGSSGAEDGRLEEIASEVGLLEALAECGLGLDALLEGDELPEDAARLASIARACAKGSSICLFDEQRFLSGPRYAARFSAALRRLADSGAVVLCAAQEDSAALGADRIGVLDAGRLVSLLEGGKP